MRTGGEILVDALKRHGVTNAFGVPGESYLAVLDALHDSDISFTICRQEGGAAMMADAYARLTGTPGICMVTRGPGATNASAGLHISQQDSVPVILLVGQVARWMVDREAFQEIDYRRMFGQVAKWVAQIDSADRIPEYLNRAFHTATSGRPGPVVLALPEDMLTDSVEAVDVGPWQPMPSHPGAGDMARLREMLAAAERPMAILGGGGWTEAATRDFQAFAEANSLPVGVSFRCQDYIDNSSPAYVGHVGLGINPDLAQRVREADLLLVAGARLGEMTTGGYSLIDIPNPQGKLVHIYPDAAELNRTYQADLPMVASMPAFAEAAAALDPIEDPTWRASLEDGRASYERFVAPVTISGDLQMGQVMEVLKDRLPADAVICNGAGNYSGWPNRFHQFSRYPSQLAPTSGSMGYGVPAAVGGKIAQPDRMVVAWAGDGCFMMHGQELATAVQYEAPILVLVVDNGMYGTIRMHQEREYPARVSGTGLKNPDFVKLAEAYGMFGARVEKTEEFASALDAALAAIKSGQPALLHLKIDPDAISPATTLSAIRKKSLAS